MHHHEPTISKALQLHDKYGLDFAGGAASPARKIARDLSAGRGQSAFLLHRHCGALECPDFVTSDDLHYVSALHSETPSSDLDLITASFVSKASQRSALAVKTSVQLTRIQQLERHRLNASQLFRFRDQDRRKEREFWLQVSARVEPDANRFRRQLVCGHCLMIQQSASRGGELRAEVATCENRFCPACCKRIAHKRVERTVEVFRGSETRDLRFITLTLKHSDQPLKQQIARLRKAFRRLRQDKFGPWRQSQHWGLAVIEVKRTYDHKWHPHLHIVSSGGFIPKRELSWAWGEATCTCRKRSDPCYSARDSMCEGRSWIVDVGQVREKKNAINYIAKYVAKPCMSPALQSDLKAGCELYIAMQRTKTWWLWGDKSIRPQLPPKEVKVAEHVVWDDWKCVKTWDEIIADLRAGDPEIIPMCEAVGIEVDKIINWILEPDIQNERDGP